jgi:cell division protein FtsB
MKRAALLAIWCVGVGVLAWVAVRHPARDRVADLEAELQNLEEQNDRIAEQNRELRRRIQALRRDPRALRRRARMSAGLARPGELIIQFDNPNAGGRLQIELVVNTDEFKLAGETFEEEALDDELSQARRAFPTARLRVQFDESVGARRRRAVLDTVRASAFRYHPDEAIGASPSGRSEGDPVPSEQTPDEG